MKRPLTASKAVCGQQHISLKSVCLSSDIRKIPPVLLFHKNALPVETGLFVADHDGIVPVGLKGEVRHFVVVQLAFAGPFQQKLGRVRKEAGVVDFAHQLGIPVNASLDQHFGRVHGRVVVHAAASGGEQKAQL